MNLEPFSLPLSDSLETAAGTIDERQGFVVRTTVDGREGIGEATPLPGWTESLEACERALRSVDDPATVLASGTDGGPLAEQQPLATAPAARHGVALAVLDADARDADRPLYRHLGGEESVETVAVNATVGMGSPEATASAARRAVDAGFPAVKVKVGAETPAGDVERLEAVRRACPAIELRADANGAWTLEPARRVLERFVDLGVSLVEQPLPAANLEGHATLRGHGVEIALDEGLVEHGIDAVLNAGAADVIVCKPMALGGVDLARAVALRAREGNVGTIVTTTVDGAYARAAAVHLAASLPDRRPGGLATGDRLAADLVQDVAPVRGGAAVVPQEGGNLT